MQLFNQSKQSNFDSSGDREPERNTNASHNGHDPTPSTENTVALVRNIQAELEKAGLLVTFREHNKSLQSEKLTQILQAGFKDKLAAAAEQLLKTERQRGLALVEQIRQAPEETLYATTLTEIRKQLQVDRALIYRFQEEQGVVLAESMVGGYTPVKGKA